MTEKVKRCQNDNARPVNMGFCNTTRLLPRVLGVLCLSLQVLIGSNECGTEETGLRKKIRTSMKPST